VEITFILKKLISALFMPLSLGLILFLIGLILLHKNYSKAKIVLTISFVWIICISYVPVANLTIKPLENYYNKIELQKIPKETKYIVLLGGDMENRAWEALKILNFLSNAKIITSGYKGLHGSTSEAILTSNRLQEIGIPKEKIIVYSNTKDTKEEALKIKEKIGLEPFILVTSAYHMPRAVALFKKEGLNPIIAPTDHQISDNDSIFSVPKGEGLKRFDKAWHEYMGIAFAWLRNQI
jgi:uncharacterized SAM-binding protein YcdF (DUF218 family)